MVDRPPGVYLACGFFVLMTLVGFSGASSTTELFGEISADGPRSIRLFLNIAFFYFLLSGLLALAAAVTLWLAAPIGRVCGLVWAGLWIAEEVVVGIWATTGPDVIQQVSGGIGDTLLRIVVAGVLFYYLWTVGASYVEDNRSASSSRASSGY